MELKRTGSGWIIIRKFASRTAERPDDIKGPACKRCWRCRGRLTGWPAEVDLELLPEAVVIWTVGKGPKGLLEIPRVRAGIWGGGERWRWAASIRSWLTVERSGSENTPGRIQVGIVAVAVEDEIRLVCCDCDRMRWNKYFSPHVVQVRFPASTGV